MPARIVVTGAFSYTGAAVAAELLRRGLRVHTLTNRRPPAVEARITSAALRFEPDHLDRQLSGADAFVNTYWVRFPHAGETFETAVRNSRMLVEAARRAGVRRFVHVSVSNADARSSLGYYAGKARVEEAVRGSGLSFAIVRPTLIVGPGDVLTNNIAWFLRRSPAFLLPDGGMYRLQPVTLADTARLIADAAVGSGPAEFDAAGPEILTFRDYVALISRACGLRRVPIGAADSTALAVLRLAGVFLRDTVLTREELAGLKEERLLSHAPPTGRESVREWLLAHGRGLGRSYVNDLRRHFGAGRADPVAP